MSLFTNLTTTDLEQSQDRLGGFSILPSGAYTGKIKAAYAGKSTSSNAQSVTVILDTNGREYRETFWITNGKGENFFRNKDDNTKKVPLPGFTIIDDMCLVTTNKALSEQTVEDKIMNVYDPDQKKELPKSVPMMVELLGKEVTFGILKQIENKQKKGDDGVYRDTNETREVNLTEKVFHFPSNLTVPEARNQTTVATFYGAWVEKNKDKTRDKTNKSGGGQTGTPGRPGVPPQAGANGANKQASLFGAR
jgi:hypothetical protein